MLRNGEGQRLGAGVELTVLGGQQGTGESRDHVSGPSVAGARREP
jgi:hypothetical protein